MKSILAFFMLISVTITYSQVPYQKDELRAKSRALTAEIAKLNKSLNTYNKGSKKSLIYIKNLENKINAQDQLVQVATKERKVLEDEIYLSQLQINKLRRELGELKKEYKGVLVNAYKNKSLQNKVLFILSSQSFTEAYRRVKYLEKYSGFQGEKADEIQTKQQAIVSTVNLRKKAVRDKQLVLAKQTVLRENLQNQRIEQKEILNEYKSNSNQVASELQTKKVQNQELESQIKNIIKEEIRIAAAKAEAERKRKAELERIEKERLAKIATENKARLAKQEAAMKLAEKTRLAEIASRRENDKTSSLPEPVKTVPEPTKPVTPPAVIKASKPEKVYASKPDVLAISKSFAASKGKLPWPVSSGEVIGRFGRQPHIVLKNIVENHAGVLIATAKGRAARSVYDGKVQAVMTISGGNKAVMVNHGDHFTVYNNLSSVFVNKGDQVSSRQELGRIFTDSDGNTLLDFQVWQGTSNQDPARWVSGM